MLPLIVLRRMDCVLEPTKDAVLKEYQKFKDAGKLKDEAIHKVLSKKAVGTRKQPLYNISKYTFKKLVDDSEGIAKNLVGHIKGFSPNVRDVFENFGFEDEIAKLESANRLYSIVKEFSNIDLHPERISNLQMGYVFEELVRKFNEQANEEAGDH
jgi:type I restriction enzyme M protein